MLSLWQLMVRLQSPPFVASLRGEPLAFKSCETTKKSITPKTITYVYFYIDVFHQLCSNMLGIYPDILHVLDLAIYCDLIASSFLEWTDRVRQPFDGRSRDERLLKLYARYLEWCQENRSPILLATCSLKVCESHSFQTKKIMKQWGPLFVLFGLFLWNHLRDTAWQQGQTNFVSDSVPPKEGYCLSINWSEKTQWCCCPHDDILRSCSIFRDLPEPSFWFQQAYKSFKHFYWSFLHTMFKNSNVRINVRCFAGGSLSLYIYINIIMSEVFGLSHSKKKHPSRWISNIFEALVTIAVVFAEHGPGRMPAEQNRICEGSYLRYRMDYNSSSFPQIKIWHLWVSNF